MSPNHIRSKIPATSITTAIPSLTATHLARAQAHIGKTLPELSAEARTTFRFNIQRVTDPNNRHFKVTSEVTKFLIQKAGCIIQNKHEIAPSMLDISFDPRTYSTVGTAGYGSFICTAPMTIWAYLI